MGSERTPDSILALASLFIGQFYLNKIQIVAKKVLYQYISSISWFFVVIILKNKFAKIRNLIILDKFGPNFTILVQCEMLFLPASFLCLKQYYEWFCFIGVFLSQPEAGLNFSTPRPIFFGPSNPQRGLNSFKNINFFNNCPI